MSDYKGGTTGLEVSQRNRVCHKCGYQIKPGEKCLRLSSGTRSSAEGNVCIACFGIIARTLFTDDIYYKIIENKIEEAG